MTLRATTLLGDNTIPILDDVVSALHAVGIDIDFDHAQPADERERAVRSGAVDLVFACGLLTMEMIRDGAPLDVVAAPLFPGESTPVYRSVIIVREDAPAQSVEDVLATRLAVNEYGSWSGWRAWEQHVIELGRSVDEHPTQVVSGGHVHSMEAVRRGIADVAAIDSSIWNASEPSARAGLRIVDQTRGWPAPPLCCLRTLPQQTRDLLVRTVVASESWVPDDGSSHLAMLD